MTYYIFDYDENAREAAVAGVPTTPHLVRVVGACNDCGCPGRERCDECERELGGGDA